MSLEPRLPEADLLREPVAVDSANSLYEHTGKVVDKAMQI